MTQKEAKDLLKLGVKITHEYFTDEEYIHIGCKGIEFEDGYTVPLDWWNKDYLQDGWSIYQ